MPITTFIDPARLPNRAQAKADFDKAMAEYYRLLPQYGNELNELVTQIDSLLAGGAYAFPYLFDATIADADPGAGKLRLSSATQNAATIVRIDVVNLNGLDITSILGDLASNTSIVKGALRITKMADPSRYLIFDVTAVGSPSGYRNLVGVCRFASHPSPFVTGDQLFVLIERGASKGDKGDKGDAADALLPTIQVRHTVPLGSNGGSSSGGVINRFLNTVVRNTIPGASLSASTVSVPAGTYRVKAWAQASGGQTVSSQAQVYADIGEFINGSSVVSPGSVNGTSIVEGILVLPSATTVRLRHYISTTQSGYGQGIGANYTTEVFAEMILEKLA